MLKVLHIVHFAHIMKDAAVSSESKMDANKKHEITFEDDSDTGSKFAYKASFFFFSCIFILLSRESNQSTIPARLGVAGHLSTTPRWGNPAKYLSHGHNK